MENISDVTVKPLEKSIYMTPLTLHFKQDGKPRSWDLLKIHDSVSIVIYNISRNVLVFVKQFRPAVYFGSIPGNLKEIDVNKYPAKLGITLELCAGIVDKDKSLEEIAAEEVYEECGYKINPKSLKHINSCQAVGINASITNIYYCEVTDEMKISKGGGVDDELIDVVEMTIPEVKQYISQDIIKSPPAFLVGLYWFFLNEYKK